MGQPVTNEMRRRLLSLETVREVTASHVVTQNGKVFDPAEFVVAERPLRFILKLVECNCWFIRHKLGTHVLVPGNLVEYADGRQLAQYTSPHWCRGHWQCEEQLQPRVIVGPARSRLV